jgi:hypothetical protein
MSVFRHPLIVEGVERTAGSRSPLQKLLVRATEMFGVSGDRFVALSRNSMKWSFHAALVKTTNSVLAAAIF